MDPLYPWDHTIVPLDGEYVFQKLAALACGHIFVSASDWRGNFILNEWVDLRHTRTRRGILEEEVDCIP